MAICEPLPREFSALKGKTVRLEVPGVVGRSGLVIDVRRPDGWVVTHADDRAPDRYVVGQLVIFDDGSCTVARAETVVTEAAA